MRPILIIILASLSLPLTHFSQLFHRFLTVLFRYLPSWTNGGEYVHLSFCISVFDEKDKLVRIVILVRSVTSWGVVGWRVGLVWWCSSESNPGPIGWNVLNVIKRNLSRSSCCFVKKRKTHFTFFFTLRFEKYLENILFWIILFWLTWWGSELIAPWWKKTVRAFHFLSTL